MASEVVLGLDVGTSGLTVLAIDRNGRIVKRASAGYPLHSPTPGQAEQDPDDWWRAAGHAIAQLRLDAPPAAVAVSGQMHSSVLLDGAGSVIRPALLWCDGRTAAECQEIRSRLGLEGLRDQVQNQAFEGFTLPKLLWLRRHEPESWARLRTVLLPKDYIAYRLTGRCLTDVSDASGTLAFDVAHSRWSAAVGEALGIDLSLWPPVVEAGTAIGLANTDEATALGLSGVPVVAGGADNACAALGLGVVDPGHIMVSIGTSGTVVAPSLSCAVDPGLRLHCFRHVLPDTWYLMGVMLSAGGSLSWFRQTFGRGDQSYDVLLAGLGRHRRRLDDPIFLPYLSGERTPHGDPDARGAFVGLALSHNADALLHAVVEGVSLGLADGLDLMRAPGITASEARVTGGATASPEWMQLLANVLGLPLVALSAEGPAWGAAMLAAVGAGWFGDAREAAQSWTRAGLDEAPRYDPDPQAADFYRERHDRFRKLYPALRAVQQ